MRTFSLAITVALTSLTLAGCTGDPDPTTGSDAGADAMVMGRPLVDAGPTPRYDGEVPPQVDGGIPLPDDIIPFRELRCACTDGSEAATCAVRGCDTAAGLTVCRRLCQGQGAEDGFPAGCGDEC